MLPEDISRQGIDHLIATMNQSLRLAMGAVPQRQPDPPLSQEEVLALRDAAARMKAARWRLVPIGAALFVFGLFQVLR